jgi:site-specific recombinase XerC
MMARSEISGHWWFPGAGALVESGDVWEPYYLSDPGGVRVEPVSEYLQAAGRPATTQRSYSLALLRWFRFTWAVEVPWNQATRTEARDFCRWLQLAGKSSRAARAGAVPARFAPATVAHCETVCRGFYGYHLEAGTGPIVNPFPLARPGRAHAHHNPLEAFPRRKAGLFRPRVPQRVPRQIPDSVFNELFARLGSNRDRALVAFWVSTGARASELLGVTRSGADPGQQLITVIRKGSRAIQQLPASPDAFVWLRLYQQGVHGLVPSGPDDALWWTLRRPFRPLSYHAAQVMFDRVNAAVGSGRTLHSLRHTAAYRLARDPGMPITDVQWVLGHASLTTTQIYVNPTAEDVIEAALAHHRRQAEPRAFLPEPARATGPRAWTCCSGRAAGDRPGRHRDSSPTAQRPGGVGAGQVPAPAGPGIVA